MSAHGPRVGIWGRFDVADYGDLLAPRIFEHELRRRLPHARVYPYAPLGAEHPIGMDGGRPATPLGPWTPARRAHLAEQLDMVAVAGRDVIHFDDDLHREAYAEAAPDALGDLEPSRFFVDGLGAEHEQQCPVVWHAVGVPFDLSGRDAERVRAALASKRYVSVRDAESRKRLLATGTEQQIDLVPDPAVLISRLFSKETIRKRLAYLRAVDSYPADDEPVVLQCDEAATPESVSEIVQTYPDVPIVLVALGPDDSDTQLADSLPAREQRVYRLPVAVMVEDLVAAIAGARAFIGSSWAGGLTALGFSHAADLQERVAAADAHFDELAAIAEESWSKRLAASPPEGMSAAELVRALSETERRHDALMRAYGARGERLFAEQLRLAEIVDAMETDGNGAGVQTLLDLAEARNRLETIDAEAAAARFERDEARAELERLRTERDEARERLVGALPKNDRPTRFRRLLPRRP
jgi:polysaccharide pyruvyl transferase